MTKPQSGAGKAPAPKRRGKRKPKPRSGPTIAEAERRERGQALLAVRVPADLISRLDAECERRGMLRPGLVRTALEEWLGSAR